MKIAVTYENGQIFQHFGHTEQFKLYEADRPSVRFVAPDSLFPKQNSRQKKVKSENKAF